MHISKKCVPLRRFLIRFSFLHSFGLPRASAEIVYTLLESFFRKGVRESMCAGERLLRRVYTLSERLRQSAMLSRLVPFRTMPIPVLLLFILFRIQKFAYSKKLLYLCTEFEDQTNPKKSQNRLRSRPVLDFVKYNHAPTRYKSIRYVLCQST